MMRSYIQRLLVALVCAAPVALGGCAGQAPVKAPPINFADGKTLDLDVAAVEVVEQYRSPMGKPNVEHLAPNSPTQAVRRWASQRLRAVGQAGLAQVVVVDASIVESQLAREQGIGSYFKTQQSQRYDGRVEVKIVIQNSPSGVNGTVQGVATRSQTVPEDISLAGREEVWDKIVREMMEDIDTRLSQAVRDGLGPLVKSR